MITYNVYAKGARNADSFIGSFPTFDAALAAFGSDARAWSIVPVGEPRELEALGSLDSIVPGYDLGRHGCGVYVIRCGGSVSTLGFGFAEAQRDKVATWLDAAGAPLKRTEAAPGTPEAFVAYQASMTAGRAYNAATGGRCEADLTPELCGLEGKRVEVVDCHGDTRRFWVGKSTGWMPVHLEVARRSCSGGCAVHGVPFKSVRVVR